MPVYRTYGAPTTSDRVIDIAEQALISCLPWMKPRPITPTSQTERIAAMCVGPTMTRSGVRYVQLRLRVPISSGVQEVDAHCEVYRDDTKFSSVKVAIALGPIDNDWDRQNVHVRHRHVDDARVITPWRLEDARS